MSFTYRSIISGRLQLTMLFRHLMVLTKDLRNRMNDNGFLKIIAGTFILFFSIIFAQAQSAKDTIAVNGIRLGFDVGSFVLGVTGVTSQKFEFSGDVGYKKILFVAEAGFARKDSKKDIYEYTQNALYLRLGIEKNLLKGDNSFFIGARYAYSLQNYETTNILIKDPYWGNVTAGGIPSKTINLHWIEGVAGLKVEVWKNFFMGYTLRLKLKVYNSNLGEYPPFNLLAYGKPDKSIQVGMSYYIFYKIPFPNKKKAPPQK